jgi:hypothetical protein
MLVLSGMRIAGLARGGRRCKVMQMSSPRCNPRSRALS